MDIPPPKNPNPRNNAFPNVLNFELWVFKVVYCKKNTTVPISCNSDINVNREDWQTSENIFLCANGFKKHFHLHGEVTDFPIFFQFSQINIINIVVIYRYNCKQV